MHVPGLHVAKLLARRRTRPGRHADETHSCLDEPPRQQQVLSEWMPAVAVTEYHGLALQVEGPPRLRPGNQFHGPFLETLHFGGRRIESVQELPTLLQPVLGNLFRRVERADPEVGRRGVVQIGADAQRAIRRPQEAAGEVARLHVAGQVLHPDVRRHVAGRGPHLGHDRAEVRRVGGRLRVPGHADVHAPVVAAVAVRQRAHQAIAVGLRRQSGE